MTERFGGTIAKKGVYVEGSLEQHAWHDTSLTAHDIKYDGELTLEVCEAIIKAFNSYENRRPVQSSYGQLRWSSPSRAIEVDVESRKLLVLNTVNLCD